MIKLTVSSEQARQRLDRVLAEALPAFSRARLQTLIHDGFVIPSSFVIRHFSGNGAVTFDRLTILNAVVRFEHENVNCERSDQCAGSRLGPG